MDNLSKENCITIKRFCEVTGFATETVRDNIKRMYPDLMQHGKTTFINQEQITRLQDEIMSHHNLADTRQVSGAKVKTQLKRNETILQAIQYLTEDNNNLKNEIEAQTKQLEAQAPKIEAFNDLINSEGLYTVYNVAKICGGKIGGKALFNLLRKDGYISKKNIAYQEYVLRGLFKIVTGSHIENDTKVKHETTKVTTKGLEFIRNKYYGAK